MITVMPGRQRFWLKMGTMFENKRIELFQISILNDCGVDYKRVFNHGGIFFFVLPIRAVYY